MRHDEPSGLATNVVEKIWFRSSPAMVGGDQMLFDGYRDKLMPPLRRHEASNMRAAKRIVREDVMRILSWMKPFEADVFWQPDAKADRPRRMVQ